MDSPEMLTRASLLLLWTGAAAAGTLTDADLATARALRDSAIKGTQAAGIAGPDLSYFGDRLTLGAGMFPNTTEKLKAWIANSEKMKPGSLMPAFDGSKNVKTGQNAAQLSTADIEAIAAYLESHTLESNFRSKFGNQEF